MGFLHFTCQKLFLKHYQLSKSIEIIKRVVGKVQMLDYEWNTNINCYFQRNKVILKANHFRKKLCSITHNCAFLKSTFLWIATEVPEIQDEDSEKRGTPPPLQPTFFSRFAPNLAWTLLRLIHQGTEAIFEFLSWTSENHDFVFFGN